MRKKQKFDEGITAQQEMAQETDFLVDAPSIELEKPGLSLRQRIVYGMIAVLSVAVVILGISLSDQAHASPAMGEMTVVGRVRRLDGSPLQAQVSIYGTDIHVMTDRSGYFQISQVPAGPQTIVTSYQGYEMGVPVELEPETKRDIGYLEFWPLDEQVSLE